MTTTTMMMTTMKKLLVIDIAHSIFLIHQLHVVKLNYDVMPNGPQSELYNILSYSMSDFCNLL